MDKRRMLMAWMGLLPLFGQSCAAQTTTDFDVKQKFRGIKGVVLVVDAVPGVDKEGVEFFNESALKIYSKFLVSKRTREILAFDASLFMIPKKVRVTWREGKFVKNYREGRFEGGIVTGDYTIEVANRIPDEVLNSIRNNGGALRLKFRLKNDGVMFGWDIERPGGGISKFDMPGGDFLETKY